MEVNHCLVQAHGAKVKPLGLNFKKQSGDC
jgi:hypothetical protein